jgi:hypothetical protein
LTYYIGKFFVVVGFITWLQTNVFICHMKLLASFLLTNGDNSWIKDMCSNWQGCQTL